MTCDAWAVGAQRRLVAAAGADPGEHDDEKHAERSTAPSWPGESKFPGARAGTPSTRRPERPTRRPPIHDTTGTQTRAGQTAGRFGDDVGGNMTCDLSSLSHKASRTGATPRPALRRVMACGVGGALVGLIALLAGRGVGDRGVRGLGRCRDALPSDGLAGSPDLEPEQDEERRSRRGRFESSRGHRPPRRHRWRAWSRSVSSSSRRAATRRAQKGFRRARHLERRPGVAFHPHALRAPLRAPLLRERPARRHRLPLGRPARLPRFRLCRADDRHDLPDLRQRPHDEADSPQRPTPRI